MNRYVNCIAQNSSEGNLLIGDTFTALIDCGMVFCAQGTIQKVKEALKGRPLDYIIFSHTHYDHIGALPFFKNEWPALRTVTSAVGAAVLVKDTPRRVIRQLSLAAAASHGIVIDTSYSDDVFQADNIVKEGDRISLGGLTVEVLETPGHTRDSLSFMVPELQLLILNETIGVMLPDGIVTPCFLTSYAGTIESLHKCRDIPHTLLSLPHRGIVSSQEAENYFDKALTANIACRNFILSMKAKGLDEAAMEDAFFRQYSSPVQLQFQPKEAFIINARAMIACILREAGQ